MLMLAVVLAPALARREDEPVAHVGHLGAPATVLIGQSLPAPKTLDDLPDLQEFGFGILVVVRSGQRPFGAGAQLGLEIADLRVRRWLRLQHYVAPGVVIDLGQRLVDAPDPLLDGFALAGQLRLEVGHLADGVHVEQLLEARLETGQVVGLQLVQHGPVLMGRFDGDIHFLRVQGKGVAVTAHRVDNLVAQPVQLL